LSDASEGAEPLIPVITGPTGVGKTAVAIALAKLAPIEIISADSRQVYRGLDIGTAKPTPEEQAAAPHHGLDLLDPRERYSAGRFARDARAWILGIASRGRLPVVVGGTGFYLRALFEGLFEEPELDEARRDALRQALAKLPAATLDAWARRLDPAFAGGPTHRASRVIEIVLLTGQPLSRLHAAPASGLRPPASPWYVVLTLPREVLRERIARRAEAMMARGLVEEARRALDAGIPEDAPGLSGVGYPEAIAVLNGILAPAAAAEAIAIATRRYAKRQETWFRHQLPGNVTMLDASAPADALARAILSGYRAAIEDGKTGRREDRKRGS
jgi:tRNA dimethylallyltransferase